MPNPQHNEQEVMSTGQHLRLLQGGLIWTGIWLMIALFSAPFLAQAGRQWYPFPVEVSTAGSDSNAEKMVSDYVPLEKAQRRWSLCASFPHMKDSYWLAVNFGLAGWVKDGDKGFRRALAGIATEITAVRYGDTGKAVQTALIEEVLDAHADIDIIAGTAVTAGAAVKVLRIRGLSDRIKVVSYYFTPEVYREIKRGHILCAPTDSPVIQERIAVDQMVRILEHRPYQKKVGPHIYVIDSSNVGSFDRSTSLAPGGFRTTYSINVRLRTH